MWASSGDCVPLLVQLLQAPGCWRACRKRARSAAHITLFLTRVCLGMPEQADGCSVRLLNDMLQAGALST